MIETGAPVNHALDDFLSARIPVLISEYMSVTGLRGNAKLLNEGVGKSDISRS